MPIIAWIFYGVCILTSAFSVYCVYHLWNRGQFNADMIYKIFEPWSARAGEVSAAVATASCSFAQGFAWWAIVGFALLAFVITRIIVRSLQYRIALPHLKRQRAAHERFIEKLKAEKSEPEPLVDHDPSPKNPWKKAKVVKIIKLP